ncbi:hypothetical protein CRUP_009867, partial [Coryphaenoides rupestris]
PGWVSVVLLVLLLVVLLLLLLLLWRSNGSPNPAQNPDENLPKRGRLQKRESFALVKGVVLLLEEGEREGPNDELSPVHSPSPKQEGGPPDTRHRHLRAMVSLLRPEDTIKLAVQLESVSPVRVRYLIVVCTCSSKHESILLGMDFPRADSDECTIGLVVPVWSDTQVYLDGDGGFSVTGAEETRIFKPVSIQTMWTEELDNLTSKMVRTALESRMGMGMSSYREYIDNEMMVTFAQMDKPTKIFDYLYLGSEWNAANFEELQKNNYMNIRVYDVEATDLLSHWTDTYKFINKARPTTASSTPEGKGDEEDSDDEETEEEEEEEEEEEKEKKEVDSPDSVDEDKVFEDQSPTNQEASPSDTSAANTNPTITVQDSDKIAVNRSGRMNLFSLMQSISELDDEASKNIPDGPKRSPLQRRRSQARKSLTHQRACVDVSPEPRRQEKRTQEADEKNL